MVVRPRGSLRKGGERIVAPDPRVVDARVGDPRDRLGRVRSGDASDVSVAAVELGRRRRRDGLGLEVGDDRAPSLLQCIAIAVGDGWRMSR
jgi:hypothetical protein